MDESEFDDSDVEEIELFTRAVSASPVSGIQRLPGIRTPSLAGSSSVPNTEKSDILLNHEIESQRSTVGDIQPDVCLENDLDACDKEKVAIGTRQTEDAAEPESESDVVSSGKRLLEHEDESLLTSKRQKLLEEAGSIKKENETPFYTELGVPVPNDIVASKTDNYAADSNRNIIADKKDDTYDDRLNVLRDAKTSIDSNTELKRDKSTVNNTDFPPIAIVSPLPEKIPSTSNSPDNFADKLDVKGFSEEESAVISKLVDYDPTTIDCSPSALDDMFKTIFPDKQDTFQTLDGNKWTFSDFQQNETVTSPEQVNEKKEDNSCNTTSENDNLWPKSPAKNDVHICPIVKEEPQCLINDANDDGEIVKDFFSGQSMDQNLSDVMETKKDLLTENRNKESSPVKEEKKMFDCALQEKSNAQATSKNHLKYSVSTECVTPPRSIQVPQRSVYEGLIKTGPPNRCVTDLALYDFIRQTGATIPNTTQDHPVIQSLLNDQNLPSKPMPTLSTGQHTLNKTPQNWQGLNKTPQNWQGLNNDRFPFSNTAKSHQMERISNMNVQEIPASHPLTTFPKQSSYIQSSSAIPMHQGRTCQLSGTNTFSPHTSMPEMNISRSGYAIQNSAGINQYTYQQSYLPQAHSGRSPVDFNWILSRLESETSFTTNENVNQPVLTQNQSFQNYPPRQEILPQQGYRQPVSHSNNLLTQSNQFQNNGSFRQSGTVNSQQQSANVRPTLKQFLYLPNHGIVRQQGHVNHQSHPPRHFFNLPRSHGNGGHQSFTPPLHSRNSAEQQQQQIKENQNTSTPLNQLQNLSSSEPWKENHRPINNISLSTAQNPSPNNSSAGNANFIEPNQSLFSLKEKLLEVINLAKVIPSLEVKSKVQAFLLRAKSAKQSNLNEHEKQAFVEETRKFILEITDLIYKCNRQTWRSNLCNSTETNPNPSIDQSYMPSSNPKSGIMAGFSNAGPFMQQSQQGPIQTQTQLPSVSSSSSGGVFRSPHNVNLQQHFDPNAGAGRNLEEFYNDLNPLERFVT